MDLKRVIKKLSKSSQKHLKNLIHRLQVSIERLNVEKYVVRVIELIFFILLCSFLL